MADKVSTENFAVDEVGSVSGISESMGAVDCDELRDDEVLKDEWLSEDFGTWELMMKNVDVSTRLTCLSSV